MHMQKEEGKEANNSKAKEEGNNSKAKEAGNSNRAKDQEDRPTDNKQMKRGRSMRLKSREKRQQ